MARSKREAMELTYPLRTAARLTGLSPELLRAWEWRHGVVEPLRTPGGTRRYSAADRERLRLVKAAVDAGNRIGQVAHLGLAELKRVSVGGKARRAGHLDEIVAAIDRLDGHESHRLLSLQLSALGAARFAREVARAAALALSLVIVPSAQAARTLSALRGGLADAVHLWVGGAGASAIDLPDAVEQIESLQDLEQRVALPGLASAGAR